MSKSIIFKALLGIVTGIICASVYHKDHSIWSFLLLFGIPTAAGLCWSMLKESEHKAYGTLIYAPWMFLAFCFIASFAFGLYFVLLIPVYIVGIFAIATTLVGLTHFLLSRVWKVYL